MCITCSTGLYKHEVIKPTQNEQHSGHNNGVFIKGIVATYARNGFIIVEKLHIYEILRLIHK